MGVDARLVLRPDARVRDVANVMGLAAGCVGELRPLTDDAVHLVVPDVRIETTSIPEMVLIHLANTRDGNHMAHYHFEYSEGDTPGSRLVSVRATTFWHGVLVATAECLGGAVDFYDTDDTDVDYFSRGRVRVASDGDAWNEYPTRHGRDRHSGVVSWHPSKGDYPPAPACSCGQMTWPIAGIEVSAVCDGLDRWPMMEKKPTLYDQDETP